MTATVEALQSALSGEHVAVYVYGVLGGRTSRSAQPALATALSGAYAAHRARRDWLVGALRELGIEPEAAAPAYQLRRDLDSPAAIREVALDLEAGSAAIYADLVAATSADQRRSAITALNDAAVRELAFGGEPSSFPGLAEFANR